MSQSPADMKPRQAKEWTPDLALLTTSAKQDSPRGYSRETLLNMLRSTNQDVFEHSMHTAQIGKALGHHLGLSPFDLTRLVLAAELHDLGKLYMDREILEKASPLTDYEIQQMRRHPIYGAQLVHHSAALRFLAPIILYHHERFDGRGYPIGLAGPEIPYLSRVLSIADALSAMSSSRPYQPKPLTTNEIVAVLQEQAGAQFEPELAEKTIGILSQGLLTL